MKRATLLLVVLAAVLFFENKDEVSAQTFQWELLTADEAAQVVRDFEGNPNLQFDEAALIDRSNMLDKPEFYEWTMFWQLYTASRKYGVSLYSRKVFNWSDRQFQENQEAFYGQPYDESVLKNQMLPVEQLETIARDYVAAHNANYASFNEVRRGSFASNGFRNTRSFLFFQLLPNGVATPTGCGMSVDTVKGRVIHYAESTYPILVSTTPTLTAAQAGQIALNTLMPAGGNVDDQKPPRLQVQRPDILGVERLVWLMRIDGWIRDPEDGSDFEGALNVAVDAHNGEIADITAFLAAGRSKAQPRRSKHVPPKPPKPPQVIINNRPAQLSYTPIVKGNTVLLYIGYVRSQGVTLNLLSKQTLEALVGERRAQLTVGKRQVVTDKERQILKTAPIEVKGRVYIPMELFAHLTGFQAHYDKQHNALKLSKPTAVPPVPIEQPIAVTK
jgi:hypothetical protein